MKRYFLLFSSILFITAIPQIVSAEFFLTNKVENKTETINEQIEMTTESKQNKNRIDRIENVINALKVSINLTEGAASKIELRIKVLDQNDENVILANTELQNARIKLIESKKLINKANDFIKNIDTKNQKDVEEIKSILSSTEKSINDSIQIIKTATRLIKTVKITRHEYDS